MSPVSSSVSCSAWRSEGGVATLDAMSALQPYRFSRAEFERMVEFGAFEDLPVELLDGVLVEVTAQGPPHASVIRALMNLLAPLVAENRLDVQMPLATDEWSLPEPDLAITERTAVGHPAAAELAVEVVVTQRAVARYKARIYAAAGVPEYWIVDVPGRTVDVLTGPARAGYRERRALSGDDRLELPAHGIGTTVAELFASAGL